MPASRAIEIEFPSELDLAIAEAAPVALQARWVFGNASDTTHGPVLHAWSNFGEIADWKQKGAVWSGNWVPPRPLIPGELVIVISALVHERAVHSAQEVSVSAEIELPGHSEPGARVTLSVAGENFGPVLAGKDGRFMVRVKVPPGVTTALAQSRDKLGNSFKRSVDLFVPKTGRLGLVCPAATVVAGGTLPIALATDRARAGQVSYEATQGEVRLGRFLAPKTVVREAGAEAAEVKITAHSTTLGDAECVVLVVPAPAHELRTELVPPYVLADGKAEARVQATVVDAFGNATGDAQVSAKEGDASLPLVYNGELRAFVSNLRSRRGVEQRSLQLSARALALRCEQRELGGAVDFRGVACSTPAADSELKSELLVEQIPERGVLLRVQRVGEMLSLVVTPKGEGTVEAVKAVDDSGAALTLATGAQPGELIAHRPGPSARFVSFTHLKSGVSVVYSLRP